MNPARNHKERTDDDDETDVFVELLAQQIRCIDAQIHEDRRGHEQRDERFVAVVMPPVRRRERHQRDRQQQRDEGQGRDERELGAEHRLGPCCY